VGRYRLRVELEELPPEAGTYGRHTELRDRFLQGDSVVLTDINLGLVLGLAAFLTESPDAD
jgi:hypothetical protein